MLTSRLNLAVVRKVVLPISSIYFALYRGRTMIVGKVFRFSASPNDFLLCRRAIKIYPVSLLQSFLWDFCTGLVEVVRVHALVPLRVALCVVSQPFREPADFREYGFFPCRVWLLYVSALFCGYLKTRVGASFGDGSGPKTVSSFEWRTVNRRIEGCVMRERNSRKEILHVVILRIIAFCEASVEVLHESFYHGIGSWVVRSGGDLFDA
jgi:hypothetical protein